MTKEDYNEMVLREQIKVMDYEGKIPHKGFCWVCPQCENLNSDLYKRARMICNTCKSHFVFGIKD